MKFKGWICGLALLSCLAACDDDDDGDNNNDKDVAQADKTFVEKVARGNMTEIEFAQLAKSKSETAMVRSFADHMISEHTAAQQELQNLADNYGNIDWPEDLDQQHEQLKDQLSDLSGYAFDSAYIQSQVADHQMVLTIFEDELDDGEEQAIRAYADKYHPHIQDHYDRADSIRQALVMMDTVDTVTDGN